MFRPWLTMAIKLYVNLLWNADDRFEDRVGTGIVQGSDNAFGDVAGCLEDMIQVKLT